jgi:hypothetical protein
VTDHEPPACLVTMTGKMLTNHPSPSEQDFQTNHFKKLCSREGIKKRKLHAKNNPIWTKLSY